MLFLFLFAFNRMISQAHLDTEDADLVLRQLKHLASSSEETYSSATASILEARREAQPPLGIH